MLDTTTPATLLDPPRSDTALRGRPPMHPPPTLLAVCVSAGGIPKLPCREVEVTAAGLVGDGRNHAKHNRPDRAVSLFDCEIMEQLIEEGYPLAPGVAGENLTVRHLHVQRLPPGTLLQIGEVILRLEQPRKPCYVLDAIDPTLKDIIVGRCGYLASVVQGGPLRPSTPIEVLDPNGRECDISF